MTDHALHITDHSVVCIIGFGYVGLPREVVNIFFNKYTGQGGIRRYGDV